jgi:hypothetical protein
MDYYSKNMDANTDILLEKINNEKSSSNLKVTQCLSKVLTSPEKIESNSGFYSLLFILIIFIIIFIIFCCKGRALLEEKIDEVIYKKFDKKENHHKKNNKKTKNFQIINIHPQKKHRTNIKKYSNYKLGKKNKIKNLTKTSNSNSRMNSTKLLTINKNNNFNIQNIFFSGNNNNIYKNKKGKIGLKNKINLDYYNDYELNSLSYTRALILDKRSFCDIYCSLLKNKQLIMFTFCSFNDYNSGIIKKFTFFLSFAVHYTINGLFFTDDFMHKIYTRGGGYDTALHFPKIILSTIISIIFLRIMLETLILTDRNVLQVKIQKTKKLALKMKTEAMKCINIKFAIFFIVNFILLVLFWFYLTCFNGVYSKTQITLIENTLISFGISILYPNVWNIFPACFRIQSLDTKNKNKQCMYTTSKILQII